MSFQRLRGFKDVYGDEARLFARVEAAARNVFEAFGFEEIRVPILEQRDLFTRAIGGETDIVQKEMYEFEDRSKEQVALRPEGTASIARAYVENDFDKTQGLAKFYYMGPMFRSERPQAGRLRQFHQVGVESIGTTNPLFDAEIISCLDEFLREAGVLGGWKIRLNNLGSFEDRAGYKLKLTEFLGSKVSKLCADCQRRLNTNVLRVLDCKNEACRRAIHGAPIISEYVSTESKVHFEEVRSALRSLTWATPVEVDPYMVRGLDYYTKTVFEVTHDGLGAQDAIAAGGRYDSLIESFGGPKVGAVGFAAGVERVVSLLPRKGDKKELHQGTVFVATLGDEARKSGFVQLNRLRLHNIRAISDFDSGSLKSQLRSAIKHGARWVVIIGDDELRRRVFKLKDLSIENAQQEEFEITDELHDMPNVLKQKMGQNV